MEKIVLTGKVFETDKVLPSGNYYPKKVVDKALKEFQERLKTETTYGKIAHVNRPENLQEYNNFPMRFAMRGIGDLNGYKEVLNFDITSIDIVQCADNENLENAIK